MSNPSSPSSQPASAPLSIEDIAAAAERRNQNKLVIPNAQAQHELNKRQEFRRLIDPGIMRPNSKPVASAAIKTLYQIADNLIKDPSNPKYQQFKPTNTLIKQRLMDHKGTIEYAIALGFRPELDNFQPYYKFNSRKLDDLRIGAAMLKEAIDLEASKEERQKASRVDQKAVNAMAAEKVKLAYMDDRKSKLLHDEREKELREARARKAELEKQNQIAAPEPPNQMVMPGSGHHLQGPSTQDDLDDGMDEDDDDDDDDDDSD